MKGIKFYKLMSVNDLKNFSTIKSLSVAEFYAYFHSNYEYYATRNPSVSINSITLF